MAAKDKQIEGPKGGKLNRAGRPKGIPNKMNGDIRQMVRKAMELAAQEKLGDKSAGAVDYLKIQAVENPTAFLGLVKGLMPKQIDVELSLTGEDLTATLQHRRQMLAERAQRAKPVNEEIEDAEVLPPPDREPN